MYSRRAGLEINAASITGAPSSGVNRPKYAPETLDINATNQKLSALLESDPAIAKLYEDEGLETQSAEMKMLFLFRHDPDIAVNPVYQKALEHMLVDVRHKQELERELATQVEINGDDVQDMEELLVAANEAHSSHDGAGLAYALQRYYKTYERVHHDEELQQGRDMHELAVLNDSKGLSVDSIF